MQDNDTLSIAYHEAAHAVAALVQGIPILNCTLHPDDGAGCVEILEFYPEGADRETLRKYAIMSLAGWEAQLHYEPGLNTEVFGPSIENDLVTARRCVGNAVTGEAERWATLDEWRADARALVAENWSAIEQIGHALIDRRHLTGAEVASLLG